MPGVREDWAGGFYGMEDWLSTDSTERVAAKRFNAEIAEIAKIAEG